MDKKDLSLFQETITASYKTDAPFALLGCAMLDDTPVAHTLIGAPLAMLNRHGLINGATGTGKTRTIQVLAEQFSAAEVPVFLMDMKGDLSGMAMPGTAHPKIDERLQACGLTFKAQGFPCEFFTLNNSEGIQLKATVSEMGADLLGRILDLSNAQQGLLEVLLKFCDEQGLLLVDTQDLKKVLLYISEDEGKEIFEKNYGAVSTSSAGTLLRKVMALEEKGGKDFLGERSFDPQDLAQVKDGKGVISILRLQEILMQPEVYTTFLLQLLSEIMMTFPERGDADKPLLMLFIDEAHLIFRDISSDLLKQIDLVVRLIRSKGVGIIFCSQNMDDIPSSILSQLGLRVSHGLRAVTAADRKKIKLTAENFPMSDFYKLDELVTSLGTGEAVVTLLDKKGHPTETVRVLMSAPLSRMGTLSEKELQKCLAVSQIAAKYSDVDPESAYELLEKRVQEKSEKNKEEIEKKIREEKEVEKKESASLMSDILNSRLAAQIGRTATRQIVNKITRGLFNTLLGAIAGGKR